MDHDVRQFTVWCMCVNTHSYTYNRHALDSRSAAASQPNPRYPSPSSPQTRGTASRHVILPGTDEWLITLHTYTHPPPSLHCFSTCNTHPVLAANVHRGCVPWVAVGSEQQAALARKMKAQGILGTPDEPECVICMEVFTKVPTTTALLCVALRRHIALLLQVHVTLSIMHALVRILTLRCIVAWGQHRRTR